MRLKMNEQINTDNIKNINPLCCIHNAFAKVYFKPFFIIDVIFIWLGFVYSWFP